MKRRFRLITRSADWQGKQLKSQSNCLPCLASWQRSTSLALALVGSDNRLIEASSGFYSLFGTPLHLWEIWNTDCLPNSEQIIKTQRQMQRQSGEHVTVDLVIEPIHSQGQIAWLVLATPVEAQSDLQEKAVLLKEIHHRVRNNLHLISNLLDLQAGTVNDERLSALFATTQNRIQAMTLIHEQLYQSADLGRIDFGEYLRRLTLNVFLANSNNLECVTPVIRVESVWLNLETAVPCGLLVNELLVNSLQHGFSDGQLGKVQIELTQVNQQIQIKIWDDGVGLAADFDWQHPDSLGLKLVRILAKQLKAEIQLEGNSGTTATLRFAELQYQTRF